VVRSVLPPDLKPLRHILASHATQDIADLAQGDVVFHGLDRVAHDLPLPGYADVLIHCEGWAFPGEGGGVDQSARLFYNRHRIPGTLSQS
jgi:hypothetical protein